ncbi:hypothetical protein KAW38_01380 [Candidatus Micrarchaeota archaeon]|nr:hypothetical protein [Candidatus Micrarchaeota archaeon]
MKKLLFILAFLFLLNAMELQTQLTEDGKMLSYTLFDENLTNATVYVFLSVDGEQIYSDRIDFNQGYKGNILLTEQDDYLLEVVVIGTTIQLEESISTKGYIESIEEEKPEEDEEYKLPQEFLIGGGVILLLIIVFLIFNPLKKTE